MLSLKFTGKVPNIEEWKTIDVAQVVSSCSNLLSTANPLRGNNTHMSSVLSYDTKGRMWAVINNLTKFNQSKCLCQIGEVHRNVTIVSCDIESKRLIVQVNEEEEGNTEDEEVIDSSRKRKAADLQEKEKGEEVIVSPSNTRSSDLQRKDKVEEVVVSPRKRKSQKKREVSKEDVVVLYNTVDNYYYCGYIWVLSKEFIEAIVQDPKKYVIYMKHFHRIHPRDFLKVLKMKIKLWKVVSF